MKVKEKELLFELEDHLRSVPKYTNPMDTAAVITYMVDLEKVNNLTAKALHAFLCRDAGEDYFEELYQEAITNLREFMEKRKAENWCSHNAKLR